MQPDDLVDKNLWKIIRRKINRLIEKSRDSVKRSLSAFLAALVSLARRFHSSVLG